MGKARLKHQPKRTSLTPNPAQLANLRPISADPVANRLQGLTSGIGGPLDKRVKCGAPCKHRPYPCPRPAAFGTGRCLSHGARRLAGDRLPPDPERLAFNAAWRFLLDHPLPAEARRHPFYQDTWDRDTGRHRDRVFRRVAFVKAWLEGTEKGEWKQWHSLVKT